MESKPIFIRSRNSCSLGSQSFTESRIDQSIELRNLPSSFLRLGRVSLRVMERRPDFLTVLKLGCNSNTEWSDNPKGGKVLTRFWSYKLGMFVVIRFSVCVTRIIFRAPCANVAHNATGAEKNKHGLIFESVFFYY